MYRAYSAADEVAAMLAAKACGGVDGGGVQDAPNFGEVHLASGIAHCHHG